MLAQKWKVFILTFISYSLIHSVRTAWSSLKYALNSAPYAFEPFYLGVLDMVVLITLAVSLNIFGPMIEKLGAKSFLLKGMLLLAALMMLIGILLLANVSSHLPYTILYPIVGFGSCVGWPASIFILSKYFEKGIAFSLWTGSSQFGDFIALVISDWLVQDAKLNPGFLLFAVASLLVAAVFLNKKYLPQPEQNAIDLPAQSPVQARPEVFVQEADPPLSNNNMVTTKKDVNQSTVNFITVWKLPGVAGYILSFLFVKSVNAVVVAWLIFYLSMIGMKKQSRIIAVLWAVSTFFGGIAGSYFNPRFNKTIFISSLLASAILFIFLQEVHLYPSEQGIILLILTCGLIFGGPFTLMTSSIPLLLSEKPQIKNIPGAKAAIISAMQGYGLLFCGVSLLIVPAVGVIDLHWVASIYCIISATVLLYEHLKELKEQLKDQIHRKHVSQPVIEPPIQYEANMSAPTVTASNRPKKKPRKTRKSASNITEKATQSKEGADNNNIKVIESEAIKVENEPIPQSNTVQNHKQS